MDKETKTLFTFLLCVLAAAALMSPGYYRSQQTAPTNNINIIPLGGNSPYGYPVR